MVDYFQLVFSDEQIFVIQHLGSVNGDRTETYISGSVVFYFKNVNVEM